MRLSDGLLSVLLLLDVLALSITVRHYLRKN